MELRGKVERLLAARVNPKENNTMKETYIYFSDNYGRRSGTERRRMSGFRIKEERRIGTDRRTCKDRRITIVDRRSSLKTSYESDRRSGQDRRGISSVLFGLEGI